MSEKSIARQLEDLAEFAATEGTFEDCHSAILRAYTLGLSEGRKWIPISERLPEPDTYVLLTGLFLPVTIGKWFEKGEMSGAWQMLEGVSTLNFPDYWQPLPTLPQTEKPVSEMTRAEAIDQLVKEGQERGEYDTPQTEDDNE